jgi:hypothetical protein
MMKIYQSITRATVVSAWLLTAGVQMVSAADMAGIMATQQAAKVIGTVTDGTEPIIGASVRVKGKSQGTVTDLDGRFQLDVAPGTELVISYLGYKEVTVKATNGMKIALQE